MRVLVAILCPAGVGDRSGVEWLDVRPQPTMPLAVWIASRVLFPTRAMR